MKILQLFRDGKEIMGTDGIMYVDGRYGQTRIIEEIKARNIRFTANFPRKLADSFAIYSCGIGYKLSAITKI